MNIRRARTIVVLVLLCFLTTCKEPVSESCRLTNITLTATSGFGQTFDYQYEGDVLKSRTERNLSGTLAEILTFEYDSNGNLTTVSSSSGTKRTLTYVNGLIVKQVVEHPHFPSRTEYEYSGNVLTKILFYGGSELLSSYTTLTYSGSSILVSVFYANGISMETPRELFYGEGKSALHGLPPAVSQWERISDPYGYSFKENNLLKTSSGGIDVNFTSEFNSSGFPTKIVATYVSGGTVTRSYSYACE